MNEQGPIPGPEEPAEFDTPHAYDVLAEALNIVLAEQAKIDAGCDEDYTRELPAPDGIDLQEGHVEPAVADEQIPSAETTMRPPETKKHSPAAYMLALFAGRLANTVVNAIEGNGKSPNRRPPTE